MISSVSRQVLLMMTPKVPCSFHDMMLLEPIEPTSVSGAFSIDHHAAFASSKGTKGSGMSWCQVPAAGTVEVGKAAAVPARGAAWT